MLTENLAENLANVRARIEAAKAAAGRTDEVTILCATKTVPAEVVAALPDLGLTLAGENRVQEFVDKAPLVRGVEWHFIGALQTNKVKYLVGRVAMIHSVDRAALADEIDRISAKKGVVTDVLAEVNVGREPQKSGVLPENLDDLLGQIGSLPRLRLRGLMTVMPKGANEALYAEMNRLFGRVRRNFLSVDTLSMGMSGDFERAVGHGSTLVRLGSAIFGQRKYDDIGETSL